MPENWTGIAAEVSAALADVGFAATLTKPGTPTGDEWDPQPGTPTTHTIRVMQDTIGLGLIDGATIQAGDIRLMAEAAGVVPKTGERMTVLGTDYGLIRVEPFAPGGVVLFYDLLLRA